MGPGGPVIIRLRPLEGDVVQSEDPVVSRSTATELRVVRDSRLAIVARIAALHGGTVVAQCSPQDLVQRPTHTGRALRGFFPGHKQAA